MKPFLLTFLFLYIIVTSHGQTVDETYPKTLWCPNDTFLLKYYTNSGVDTFTVSRKDNISPGDDAMLNIYAIIYYGKDSVKIRYNNRLPYQHNIYVKLESPKGKTTLRFHFNAVTVYFPPSYMEKNKGNIQFDIPESYELANIIWTLSPTGERSTSLYKGGEYYKKVVAYFKPYLKHPIFKALDFPDSISIGKYFDFRENSFAFNFKDPKIGSTNAKLLFNGPYYYVYGEEFAESSQFGKLKTLVEDFVKKSNFRQFYKSNLNYYNKEIQRTKDLLPVKQMWDWLELQFPKPKYQSYRIVFSPLIGGSHSTQRYTTYNKTERFGENVMFICGAGRYDTMPNLSEKQKEGLFSGVVFTEIDHNYVNPSSNKYARLIDSIFSRRNIWAESGPGSDFYNSAISVFNEYMTHAVFCLYVSDTYDKSIADFVIDNREQLMVNRRKFIRFKEFNRELMRIRKEHSDLKVTELYPLILEWSRFQL